MIIQFFLRARPTAHFPIVTPVKTSGGKTNLLTKDQLCYDLASYFQFIVSLSEFEAIKNLLFHYHLILHQCWHRIGYSTGRPYLY